MTPMSSRKGGPTLVDEVPVLTPDTAPQKEVMDLSNSMKTDLDYINSECINMDFILGFFF